MKPVRLAEITSALERADLLVTTSGALPDIVAAIADDSRDVRDGSLFIAVRGSARDGHDFLEAAAAAGAAAAIVEDPSRTELPSIVVRDGRRAAAVAAAAFYREPASAMRFIAVTGTNGKTTTVGMLRHLFDAPAARSASIGTLGCLVGSVGESLPGTSASLTTPGPVELQRTLRALADAGVRTVAIEVSSHSLHQRRVEGIRFSAAVFTNLTRDHLDYHGTMEEYFNAKASLLTYLTSDGAAVVNADDHAWDALPAAPRRVTFGLATTADVRAGDLMPCAEGNFFNLYTPAGAASVLVPLIGDFNVSNALGAAATGFALGMNIATIAARLETQPQVPGRLEIISKLPMVLRDYAHTPDALERALKAVRAWVPQASIVVVFGAGGDRDRGKRPLMGKVADVLADRVILTSDNPRTEDPERILDDIAAGMTPGRYERIVDRRAAIEHAIATINPLHDLVLLAGKGHEDYQVRGTQKFPFDEKAIVAELVPQPPDGPNVTYGG
jgi:UDP-N-acetylmuramoyl-L-alanyl-D-glutamate--2,6-diaminopimelate ligase